MTRDYCDRCGVDVTGEYSGAICGVADADRDGNGNVTHSFVCLCVPCYTAAIEFIKTKPARIDAGEHLAANGKPIDEYPRQQA